MAVPFAFANLSGNIALSKLDSNFNTPITIGNTSVQLGGTITTLNNMTLSNVIISGGTNNVTETLANVTTLNATSAFITTGNISTANVGNLTLLNALTVPNGGTGMVTLPVNSVLLGNGTSPVASVAPGTAGNVLTSIGGVWTSNAASGGGGGSPGGSDTQIQFNNSGAFGGNANFTYVSPTATISSSTGIYNALIAQTTSTTRTDRPIFLFKRTQTPAVGSVTSYVGEINFNSKTQTGVAVNYAKISSSAFTSNGFTSDISPRIDFDVFSVTSGSAPSANFSMQGRTTPLFVWSGYDGSTQATILLLTASELSPGQDNFSSLGSSGGRWSVVYSATGTINTSDRNEKQDIEEISDAERRAAARVKNLIRKFKFKDAVAKKGDSARIHFGVIAQDVQEAFLAEGLDASKYGLFCSDTFKTLNGKPVSKNEETGEYPEGSVESTKLGVRYEELLCFVIAST
jgi:hypothetical protein